MLLKPRPIEIGKDAFEGFDALGRAEAAHQLTELVDRLHDPLVIALDGGWGSGKSWFLKLWPGEHKKRGGKATLIYFDAFAHDFIDDPLASLALKLEAEIDGRMGQPKAALDNVTQAARQIAFPAARILAALATLGASEVAATATGAIAKELEPLRDALWKAEKSRIDAMQAFREGLTTLAEEHPLVFIVDELDRCRPDYALATLEVIKHFFDVPRVHFVLGANLAALRASVTARYGSGMEDAGPYLQKFVNLPMALPDRVARPNARREAAPVVYLGWLVNGFREQGHPLAQRRELLDELSAIATLPGIASRLNLRVVERILDRIALFPGALDRALWPEKQLAVFAAILEATDRGLFNEFMKGSGFRGIIYEMVRVSEGNDIDHSSNNIRFLEDFCRIIFGEQGNGEAVQILVKIYTPHSRQNFGEYFRERLGNYFGEIVFPVGEADR